MAEVLPANEERAEDYSRVNPKDQPLKYLHQDGSVTESLSANVTHSVLPDGGSTEAKQDSEISLLTQILEKDIEISIDAEQINLNTDNIEENQLSGLQKTQVVDDSNVNVDFATEEKQDNILEILSSLQDIYNGIMAIAGAKGIASDLRTTILSGVITTVTTVTTVTGITNIGGVSAAPVVPSLLTLSGNLNLNNVAG